MTQPVFSQLLDASCQYHGDIAPAASDVSMLFEGIAIALLAPEYAQAIWSQMPNDIRDHIEEAANIVIRGFPVEVVT